VAQYAGSLNPFWVFWVPSCVPDRCDGRVRIRGEEMKSRFTVFIVVLAFLVSLMYLFSSFGVPVYAGAAGSGWIRDRSVARDPEDEFSPSMATDSKGNLYVAFQVYDPGGYSFCPWLIQVYNSTDGGDTWNPMLELETFMGKNPSITVDVGDNDHIFVAYEERRPSGEHWIYCKRYIDGTWLGGSPVDDTGDNCNPSITSEYWYGESNCVYISYEQVDQYGDRDLMFAKSTDDGETWQTQKLLADGNSYSQTSITTVHSKVGQDFIYIAYKIQNVVEYSIAVARSSDRGNTWEHRTVYEETQEVNWPSIVATHGTGTVTGGTVVIAWQIYPSDTQREDLWYAWSQNDGDTWWSSALAEERDVREMSPKLTVDGQGSTSTTVFGYIHVVYLRVLVDDPYYVDVCYQKTLYNSPTGWSSVEIVNEEHSAIFSFFDRWRHPAITTQEREGPTFWERTYACVAWTDSRNESTTGYDIYYSTPGATYTIAANPSGQGLKVQVNGVNYTESASFNWPAGSSHNISASSPQKESSTERYAFTRWSDDGPQSHSVIVGTTDLTITANYIKQYKITFQIATAGPSHTDLNSTNYVTVVYRSCEAFLNVYVWDASPAIVWVDNDTIASYILYSSGSTVTHRWYAPTNPSYKITNTTTYNPTIWDQYKPRISADVGGSGHELNSTNYVELTFYRFGLVGTFNFFGGNDYNNWVDAGSSASLSNPSQQSTPTHRWFSSGLLSWTINDASTRIATYYEQFKPEISVITANTPKLNSTNYVTVFYIQNDEPKTYNICDGIPFSDWCDIWSEAHLSHPSSGSSSTERWDTDDETSWKIDAAHIIQVTFHHQYYLTVSSPYDMPGGAGWYEEGSTAYATLDALIVYGDTGTRYGFTHWSGDASGTNQQSDPIIMDAPKIAVANWVTQYYLTINLSPLDVPVTIPGEGWYNQGGELDLIAPTPVALSGDTQYRFDHWTIGTTTFATKTITVTMDNPKTATAYYIKQFKFTVSSDHGSPIPSVGEYWIDEGEFVAASVTSPADQSDGTRYRCTRWTGSGSVPSSGTDASVTFTMTAPSTMKWEWIPQYQITFTESGPETGRSVILTVNGEPHPGITIYDYTEWFDEGSPIMFSISDPIDSATSGKRYVFVNWKNGVWSVITSPQKISAPDTFTGHYKTQYQLTIDNGGHGITTPTSGNWYDTGEWVTTTMISDTTSNATDTKYLFDSWTGTGLGNYTGPENPCQVQMNAPITEAASWKAQYYLTVSSPYGTPGGAGWFDEGSTAHATLDAEIISGAAGVRYVFTQWSNDASGTNYAQSDPITIDEPKTATANWKTQYYLTIDTDPAGLTPQPNISIAGPWYDSGTQVNLTAEIVEGYKFDHWDIDGTAQDPGANPISLTVDTPHTATVHYTTVAPAFPLWWLGVIVLIVAAATVIFILAWKRILTTKTTPKP